MNPNGSARACLFFLLSLALAAPLVAQSAAAPADQPTKPARTPIFVDPSILDLHLVLDAPPANDSKQTKRELSELHAIQQSRTPAEAVAAKYDEDHEDIFIYNTVLGPLFVSDTLPQTFTLSKHLRNDAGLIDSPLKKVYRRTRPYNLDSTLHSVCEVNKEGSYPSGHTLNGYLYALALAQIVPEKHEEILARADVYARNRMVCGAHYPSDLEASRRVADILFGYMLGVPRFQQELAAARRETRLALHLSEN